MTTDPVAPAVGAACLKTRIRLFLGEEIALGPGKAELLAAIAATGSISAAGRQLGMSYRRAWLLVETMNHCFREPLVISAKGGKHGGGAHLSALGQEVLTLYQHLQAEIDRRVADYAPTLYGWLRQ